MEGSVPTPNAHRALTLGGNECVFVGTILCLSDVENHLKWSKSRRSLVVLGNALV